MKMQLQVSASLCVFFSLVLAFFPLFVAWLESFKYDFICAASCGCFAYLTALQLICSAAKSLKVAGQKKS